MSSFFSGQNGSLYINGTKAASVQNWSISSSIPVLDTTTLGDTDSTVTYGVRTTTGQCRLFYYQSQPGVSGDASLLLRKLIKSRTTQTVPGVAAEAETVTLKLQVEDGTANGKAIEVEAYITSVTMEMAVGSVLSTDIGFQVNGAPKAVTL